MWGKAPSRTQARGSQTESPAPPARSASRKQTRVRTSAPTRRDERYVLGVEVAFPGFARTDVPPPHDRTRPEDHPYARHTSRIQLRARIGPVWGAWNRIAKSPYVYYYDVWSNMHYGFVGRVAGFNLEELMQRSNAAQEADSETKDPRRDAESVQAGSDLFARLNRGAGVPYRPVFHHDLTTILTYHEPSAGDGDVNGWGKKIPSAP